jgi:hypothetical protein
MRSWSPIIAAGFGLILSGCGSSPAADSKSSPPVSASPTIKATPTPKPTPEPTKTAPLALGNRLELEKGVTIQIVAFRTDAPAEGSIEAGQRLDVALIKACNGTFKDDPDGGGVGSILRYGNFTLVDGDSGEYQELDLTPSPAPQPQLNANAVLAEGTCKKGWKAFALPRRTKILTLSYNSNGESLGAWGVSK